MKRKSKQGRKPGDGILKQILPDEPASSVRSKLEYGDSMTADSIVEGWLSLAAQRDRLSRLKASLPSPLLKAVSPKAEAIVAKYCKFPNKKSVKQDELSAAMYCHQRAAFDVQWRNEEQHLLFASQWAIMERKPSFFRQIADAIDRFSLSLRETTYPQHCVVADIVFGGKVAELAGDGIYRRPKPSEARLTIAQIAAEIKRKKPAMTVSARRIGTICKELHYRPAPDKTGRPKGSKSIRHS